MNARHPGERAGWKGWLAVAVPLLAGALLLAGAARENHKLLDLRRTYGLTQVDPLENMPPMVAFTTVALGGFRGLLADWLWLRATRLQDEGKYFELVQLAEWITRLEPRFTEVWAFHAWNLAYNVSVLFQEPEDRWRWVSSGVRLLRDRGLRYNPGSAALYRELGWIFQHKFGAVLDDAHGYYKQAWAHEMATLFDGPGPDYEAVSNAAGTTADLLSRPGLPEWAEALRQTGVQPFDHALLARTDLPPETAEILVADTDAAREGLLFLRVQRMREVYKLDPERMRLIDEQYGPLDWRLPEAHAIYWAVLGREYADGFDRLSSDRMIFQSLAEALRRGRLFIDHEQGIFIPSPNLDLLPRVRAAYEEALVEHPGQPSIETAHRNFLRESILYLYTYNRIGEAREVFEDLQERYPGEETAATLEALVFDALRGQLEEMTPRAAMALVEGALFQSYFWLALGDAERAAGYEQLARTAYRQYQAGLRGDSMQERLALPPMPQIRERALEQARGLFQGGAGRERIDSTPPARAE